MLEVVDLKVTKSGDIKFGFRTHAHKDIADILGTYTLRIYLQRQDPVELTEDQNDMSRMRESKVSFAVDELAIPEKDRRAFWKSMVERRIAESYTVRSDDDESKRIDDVEEGSDSSDGEPSGGAEGIVTSPDEVFEKERDLSPPPLLGMRENEFQSELRTLAGKEGEGEGTFDETKAVQKYRIQPEACTSRAPVMLADPFQ